MRNIPGKFLILLVFTFSALNSPAQRPNIIYIMTDDMGYGDLSEYGRADYQTPHIDKLASEGMKFTSAYSAGSLCTPTRTALMTGRYPARTPVGLLEPLTPTKRDSAFGLSADYTSIATLLKNAGYKTALIGKWHLGFRPEHYPLKNGFDYFFGITSGAADYFSHVGDGGQHDLFENNSPVYPEGYLTDLFSQKAVTFLEREHEQPFFLVLTYNAPHWPWQGPGDKAYPDSVGFRAGGSPEIYKAMMKSLDDGVGAVMKALDDLGLAGNTLVIFTNDNGGERYSNHAGLARSKTSLWEGGIKVPALVRWPGKIAPGSVTNQVVITMDWSVTMLSAAGTRQDKRFPMDGIDVLPIMTQSKQPVERTLYWRTFQRSKQKAMMMGEWKFIKDENGEYLFDIKQDPFEKSNLIGHHPEIVGEMKEKYSEWEGGVLTPIGL